MNKDTNTLLGELEDLRFGKENAERFEAIIDELVARGVYKPTPTATTREEFGKMVSGWGARWHEWTTAGGPLECPSCKADLRDYKAGPPFKRVIGLSNRDRIHTWQCPDCNHQWARR